MIDENALISMDACETNKIINYISNFDVGTQSNTDAETNPGSIMSGNPRK